MMRILATEYSLKHQALEIYVAGCHGPHCPGCANPESWEFDQGMPYTEALPVILEKLDLYEDLIKRVWIMGGEPLDQELKYLLSLVYALRARGVELWLFTHYDLDEAEDYFPIDLFDYVKTGRYDRTQLTDSNIQYGVQLASANQTITKMNKEESAETLQG